MNDIRAASRALENAKQVLHATVQQARRDGRTWAEIGEALGISRQAAFKRFGEPVDPSTGRRIEGAPVSVTALTETTERVFDLIAAGRADQVTALLHPDVRQELPAELITETWARVLAEIGAKERFVDTHAVMPAGERITEDQDVVGIVVGVTTITCEAGEVVGRVAFDAERRIVGLLLVAPDAERAAF